MNWRAQERKYRQQERETARLEADQHDRYMNPQLYLKDALTSGHHSDLENGDAQRDKGKRR